MSWPTAYVPRATWDSEGDRFAPAVVTPEGTWLAATDVALKAAMKRANDKRWRDRLKS